MGIYLMSQNKSGKFVECMGDADCRLIYHSCDCEAIPLNDMRDYIEGISNWCIINTCARDEIKAICRDSKCIRSDNRE